MFYVKYIFIRVLYFYINLYKLYIYYIHTLYIFRYLVIALICTIISIQRKQEIEGIPSTRNATNCK